MDKTHSKKELRITKEEEEKLRVFLQHYSHDISIHGVKHAFDETKSRTFRVGWMVLGVFAIISLLKTLSELYIAVQEYKAQTVIKVNPTDELPFPAVTICNLNGLELSKLATLNTKKLNVSGLTLNMTLDLITFGMLRNRTRYPPEFLNVPFQNFSRVGFADLFNTLPTCYWDGKLKRCDILFKPLDLEMQRCFQFNGRIDRPQVLSHTSGLNSGLQVIIDIRQEQYLITEGYTAGVQVLLHEPGEMPDTINKGFFAQPGLSVFCKVHKEKYTYLPLPFKAYGKEACVEKMEVKASHRKRNNISLYSDALCRRMCADRFAQDICGCRLSDASAYYTIDEMILPQPGALMRDYQVLESILCSESENAKITSSNCKCPRRCAFTAYTTMLSSARFPSDVTVALLPLAQTMESGETNRSISKNYLNLKIFFDDLVYKHIQHVPEYTLQSILGSIGGQLGLFLGASMLSVIELSYLLFSVCKRGGREMWKKIRKKNGEEQETDTKNQQEPEKAVESSSDDQLPRAASELQTPLHGAESLHESRDSILTTPSDTASFVDLQLSESGSWHASSSQQAKHSTV